MQKGDRVVPSGKGRTATWPKNPGTILRKMTKDSWEVQWDGAIFQDKMRTDELSLLEEKS